MEYRPLGRTDIRVSVICLGSMTWGEQNTPEDAFRQIDRALARGVNFLDTAEMYSVPVRAETYGRTEEILGEWLKASGRRDEVVIATKVTGRGRDLGYIRPHLHGGETRLDRASILEAVEGSLRRLGTDHIDLYQLHWPERATNYFGQVYYDPDPDDDAVPIEESLRAMEELVRSGKVRHIGVSNETPWGVMQFLRLAEREGLSRIVSIQNPYNLLNRLFEAGNSEVALMEDVGLLAYSPLAMGALSGKYLDGAWPEGARLTRFGHMFKRYLSPRAQEQTARFVDIARRHGLDPAVMAHAFVNSRPFVTANIVGATTLDQLEAALDSAAVTLPQSALDEIAAVHAETPVGY